MESRLMAQSGKMSPREELLDVVQSLRPESLEQPVYSVTRMRGLARKLLSATRDLYNELPRDDRRNYEFISALLSDLGHDG